MISKNDVQLVRQLDQRKYRREQGLFVAEGPKVVGELMAAGFRLHRLFATADYACPTTATVPTTVSQAELERLSLQRSPHQVLAVFHIPDAEPLPMPLSPQLYLALDGVQDPGNVGTIIRIADWFGIDTVFCSPETADAWNPKVVQATMGSIARVRLVYGDLPTLLEQAQLPLFGTLLDGENLYTEELPSTGIIVMGNEAAGLSAEVRRMVTHRLRIPSFAPGPHAESLNVATATAIVCAELRRRQI